MAKAGGRSGSHPSATGRPEQRNFRVWVGGRVLTLPPKHTRLLRVDLTPASSVDTWPDCSTRARTNANKAAQADTERGREGPIMRALAARATPHAGLTPRFGPSGLRLASADLLHAARERTPQPRRCTRETSRTQTRSGHVQHKRHTSGAGVRDRPQKFAGALRPGRLATAIPHWGQQPQVGERGQHPCSPKRQQQRRALCRAEPARKAFRCAGCTLQTAHRRRPNH